MSAPITRTSRDRVATAGVVGAACAACCAGPVIGFVGAWGLGALLGAAVLGAAGLGMAVIIGAVFWHRRSRTPASEPVGVAAPVLRREAEKRPAHMPPAPTVTE